MNNYKPKQIESSVYDIDLTALRSMGITLIICDIDNTLVPWNRHEMTGSLKDWANSVVAAGFKLVVVSNNNHRRVSGFAAGLSPDASFVAHARKPNKKGFLSAAGGTPPSQCAVIGDQIMTDILGGNRAGMHTILVNPLDKREFFGTKLNRLRERFWLWRLGIKRCE